MGTSAGLSANAIARWARHFFLYNCELFRIHITRLFYPAIALAGHAFIAVIAVWVVTWHSITPFLILPVFAATFRVGRSAHQALLVRR
jgi:hypothetical protein